mmetsp:Transcript_11831/g.21528  ORF Transcript_11831/g.21528 Transcript_11831/m.21528 type:complete len:95 (+) Transcript_11831:64-348(+)
MLCSPSHFWLLTSWMLDQAPLRLPQQRRKHHTTLHFSIPIIQAFPLYFLLYQSRTLEVLTNNAFTKRALTFENASDEGVVCLCGHCATTAQVQP